LETVVPFFLYQGRDSEKGLELRKLHREEHLDHLRGLDTAGRIRFAGPLIDADQNPCGSVIVLEAASLTEAKQIAESDPYRVRGIFSGIEVFETKVVFPSTS
jgi:uncharacterized protein YciI